MFGLLAVLSALVAVALIFVVVIQNSKGGGLSSTFGGAGGAAQLLGSRRSTEFIEKLTWYLAGALAVIAFVANIIGTGVTGTQGLRSQKSIEAGEQYIDDATNVIDPNAFQGPADGAEE